MDRVDPARAREEAPTRARGEAARRAGRSRLQPVLHRFVKFGAVGAGGVIVQMGTLALLLRFAGLHYLAATILAVEAAVIHNFVWHRCWTWSDRPRPRVALSLLRFNATNGAMSLFGNLAAMFMLVGILKLNPLTANLITIAICSVVSFTLADRLVFI
jgi:dolichol-phosphate mannosyltransferase